MPSLRQPGRPSVAAKTGKGFCPLHLPSGLSLQRLSDPLDVQQIAVTDVVRGGGATQRATAQHNRRSETTVNTGAPLRIRAIYEDATC